jgi:hypothetical protein
MRLVSQADFHVVDPETGEPYLSLAGERIHDSALPMPPTSQDPLTESELATLTAWLAQEAPEANCAPPSEFPEVDAGTQEELPPTVPGIVYDPIEPDDCEQLIELRAHDPNDPSQGFPVSTTQVNSYECFVFEVPYDGKMHGLQVEPIIDDARVLHHWLVYEQAGASENGYYNCTGQHPAAQLLAGWAPGRGATVMPRDVGLKLPQKGSAAFVIEVHYNNAARHQNVRDRSGARVCATSKLKTNEAAVHWLGTEAIFLLPGAGQAVGTCTAPQKSVVLNSWPHMHALGSHMKGELTRKDGTKSVLFDNPFSFDDQRSYDTPVILEPGDKIRTTCSYENDSNIPLVGFGTDSEAEMCYNFVLAYPAGSLASGVSLTGTNSTCIDPL